MRLFDETENLTNWNTNYYKQYLNYTRIFNEIASSCIYDALSQTVRQFSLLFVKDHR